MKQMQRKKSGVGALNANRAAKKSALPSTHVDAGADAAGDRELPVSNAGSELSPATASPAMTASPRDSQLHSYELSASCTVRDCVALKSALLDLLMDPQPVTINVSAVERIDTAALQLLCAFVRDRHAAGGQVLWTACTESFSEAIRLLGLQKVLAVPDELLIGSAA
jgi:anti-anti-sigma regulatory factor